jgi:hypothetical protein
VNDERPGRGAHLGALGAATLIQVQRKLARRSGARRRRALAVIAIAAAAAAWIASSSSATAPTRWLWVAVLAQVATMMRVPFVLYWRADASLLARLPIRGRPLFDAALWSIAAIALEALAISWLSALPLSLADHGASALLARAVALSGALAIAAAAGIPAVAVAAGSMVVSDKAKLWAKELGGDVAGPPTAWLGVLPGIASAGVVLVAIDVAGWLGGGAAEVGDAPVILTGLALASLLAVAAARAVAERVVPAMLRDVSALDRQQLATIEIAPAPRTLRWVSGRASTSTRLLLDKHARLIGRRYPMSALLGFAVAATIAITALASPSSVLPAGTALLIGLVYAWLLGERMHRPPIELGRLLASLPISGAEAHRAARIYVLWWWGLFVGAPSVAWAARSPAPLTVASVVGACAVLLWVVAGRTSVLVAGGDAAQGDAAEGQQQ